jgi:hydroxymethylglutaryl-CoA synthase
VLKIDAQWEALFSREVMDFWRPHYRHNALVNGQVSVTSYMEALRRTYGTHKVMSGFGWDDYDYMLFHVPFPKMAVKGLRALYDLEVESGAIEKARTFDGEFAARTDPALWANREVGNVYSGSLYLSLGALLEGGESCLADARIGLYSYGSGCCAEYFSGTLGGDPAAWRGKTGLVDCLKRRVELDHAQYIKMRREGERLLGEGSFNARRTTVSAPGHDPMKGVSFRGIRDHQRVYERTDPMVGQHARNTCAPAPRLIFNDAYGVAGAVCVP